MSSGSRGEPAMRGDAVRLRAWDAAEFERSESQWQGLLHRSTADPLFMSWSWQWSWWRHHAATLNSELVLLAGYAADGELIGLAPFHLRRATHRRPLAAMRLETLGSTWRDERGAYSEYLDFLVEPGYEAAFGEQLSQVLSKDRRWSDLVIANSRQDSMAARWVAKYFGSTCYVRPADPIHAHKARLPRDFLQYVKALHPGVRRRVWNHRSKLHEPRLVAVSAAEIAGMFDLLNDFHRRRWGVQLFVDHFRAFHLNFAELCARNGTLRMSTLHHAGKPVSAIYDVRIGAVEYNLQSGFDSSLTGMSPGYLHLGYCMENASAEGVEGFDFLAGDGRNRNYKQDFLTQPTPLLTLQCIRARAMAWLYRKYDRRRPAVIPDSSPRVVPAQA